MGRVDRRLRELPPQVLERPRGDTCLVGFSSRKSDLTLYLGLGAGFAGQGQLLGKHKLGKGCLYLRRLADVDLPVLERLVAAAVAEKRELASE